MPVGLELSWGLETVCCPLCGALETYRYFVKLVIIVLSPVWTYPRHRPHPYCKSLRSRLKYPKAKTLTALQSLCLQQAAAVRILRLLRKMILSWKSLHQIQSAWEFQGLACWSHLMVCAGRHVSDVALIFRLPRCLSLDWDFFPSVCNWLPPSHSHCDFIYIRVPRKADEFESCQDTQGS